MLPYRLVYHERYDLNLGEHVFPSRKFRWLRDRLLHTRFATAEDFIAPEPATDEFWNRTLQWLSAIRATKRR